MPLRIYYDDIEVGAVQTTGSYTVTREEILEFGQRFDPQPFHRPGSTRSGGSNRSAPGTRSPSSARWSTSDRCRQSPTAAWFAPVRRSATSTARTL